MRRTSLDCVYQLACRDDRVIFIGSDLGAGVLADMKKNMPERWIMEGVSEQHIIGMAAGLSCLFDKGVYLGPLLLVSPIVAGLTINSNLEFGSNSHLFISSNVS